MIKSMTIKVIPVGCKKIYIDRISEELYQYGLAIYGLQKVTPGLYDSLNWRYTVYQNDISLQFVSFL